MPVGGGAGGEAPLDTFDLWSPDSASTLAWSDWSGIAPAITPSSFQPNEASIPSSYGVVQHQEAPEFTLFSAPLDALSPHASSADSLAPVLLNSLLPCYPMESIAQGGCPLPHLPAFNISSLAPSPASFQHMMHAASPQGSPPVAPPSRCHGKKRSSFVLSILPFKLDVT